jgi:hypothetical protein
MSSTISRRSFLKGTSVGGGVAVLSTGAGALLLSRKAEGSAWMDPTPTPVTPDAHQTATLNAMADTFLPNWDGTPGGLESSAFTTINDPFYGLNPYISQVVSDLDDWCWWNYWWSDFVSLGQNDRNNALEQRMGYQGSTIQSWYIDAYFGMLDLTKLNYFGGLVNSVGTNYINYPGPSAGYDPGSAAGAYQSTDTNWQGKPIPDNNPTGNSSWVYVGGTGTVSSFVLSLYITHTWVGDLVVTIYAPNGTSYCVWNRAGGSQHNIVINDQSITAFNGVSAQGWWKITVQDLAAGDVGVLQWWGFKLRTNLDG